MQMSPAGWKCPGTTRWWSQKLTGNHSRRLICPCNSSVVWVQVCGWVHVCLPETRNTPGTENRAHFTPTPPLPAPSAGSELRMNNGWIQLCWRIPPGKANSQSQTTTFEHLQLRKLRDGICGWLISQAAEWDKMRLLDIAECFTKPKLYFRCASTTLGNESVWQGGTFCLWGERERREYGGPGVSTKKSSVKAAICLKMQIPSLNYSFLFFSPNSTVLSQMKITTSCIFISIL